MLTCNSELILQDGQTLYAKTNVKKGTTVSEMNDAIVKSVFSSLKNEISVVRECKLVTIEFAFTSVKKGDDPQIITLDIPNVPEISVSKIVTEYAVPELINKIDTAGIRTQIVEN